MLASNASTLVLLAKVGCLELFIRISPTIEIPIQVKKEVLFEKDSYYSRLIDKLIKDKRIRVVLTNKSLINKTINDFNLDEGEAATYAVYNSKRHKAILTDDGELIKLCKLKNIEFICAMAVIIRLNEKQMLSKEESIEKLEELNKIGRYSKELYEYFKNKVN